jgi:hypothetical protein
MIIELLFQDPAPLFLAHGNNYYPSARGRHMYHQGSVQ